MLVREGVNLNNYKHLFCLEHRVAFSGSQGWKPCENLGGDILVGTEEEMLKEAEKRKSLSFNVYEHRVVPILVLEKDGSERFESYIFQQQILILSLAKALRRAYVLSEHGTAIDSILSEAEDSIPRWASDALDDMDDADLPEFGD